MDANDLTVIIMSIIGTFLGVLPGLILWQAFSITYITRANLWFAVAMWVVAMGLAIGVIVTTIDWTDELLMNLVGIALIIIGLVYVAGLLIMLVKFHEDTDDRNRHYRQLGRQSVGT